MKNLLLITTALVGLSVPAIADEYSVDRAPVDGNFKVTVGGKIDAAGAFSKQKNKGLYYTAAQGGKEYVNRITEDQFIVDTDLNIKADGKSDYGIQYGAEVLFRANNYDNYAYTNYANGTNYAIKKSADEAKIRSSYLYVGSEAGRVELGSMEGAARKLAAGAHRIALGTGGIDGNAMDFVAPTNTYLADVNGNLVNRTTGVSVTPTAAALAPLTNYVESHSLSSVYLPGDKDSERGSNARKTANKISYYTANFNGLVAGISYTRDNHTTGTYYSAPHDMYSTTGPQVKDLVTAAVAYDYAFNDAKVNVSLTGAHGKTKRQNANTKSNYRNVNAFAVGANVDFMGVQFAGSFGDNGKSLNNRALPYNKAKSKYWTGGVALTNGPVGVSATYLGSKHFYNKFEMMSVAAEYEVAKGLTPYAEANFYKQKPGKHTVNFVGVKPGKNSGHVVFVGAKLFY